MTPSRAEKVWYLAYGSNMSSSTFRGSRGIEPLAELAVKVPGWALTFEIYGLPYKEPAFASIRPFSPSLGSEKAPEVHGIAYLVTREQYISILASEAGDVVYSEAELLAEPLDPEGAAAILGKTCDALKVVTLVTGFACSPPRLPSARYKEIMVEGGMEASLPDAYQDYLSQLPFYHPPKSIRRLVGAALFLAVYVPLFQIAEALSRATRNADGRGNVPPAVKSIVRCLLFVMWLHHDYLHAPLWGRGDGLDGVAAGGRCEEGYLRYDFHLNKAIE